MLTDTACKNAKPAAKLYKMTDAGGLQLWVTPTAKLWNLAYRFNRKQLKLSIGPYPEVTLAAARSKRDAAKAQISQGIDPNQAKKEAKRQLADAKTFADWADDWIAKEKLKWDLKTMAGKERYVGYLKKEFGDRTVPKIARRDVLTFLKAFEADEKLETRDRTRATGEKICLYADQDGTDYNPFRNLGEQLVDNDSTPRPALTDPAALS